MKKHPTRDLWLGNDGKLYLSPESKEPAMSAVTEESRSGAEFVQVFFFVNEKLVIRHYGRAVVECMTGRLLNGSEAMEYKDGNPRNVLPENLSIRRRKPRKRVQATIVVDLRAGNRIKIPDLLKGCTKLKITFQELR